MELIIIERIIVQAVCDDGKVVEIEPPEEMYDRLFNIIKELDSVVIRDSQVIHNN